METAHQIRLKLENFRAIKEADIILDGITVVAGENGCGKSTLSKFLYYAFKNSINYKLLVDQWREKQMEKIFNIFDNYIRENAPYFIDTPKGIDYIIDKFEKRLQNDLDGKYRMMMLLLDTLGYDMKDPTIDFEKISLEKLIEQLKEKINQYNEERNDQSKTRPLFLLANALESVFSTKIFPKGNNSIPKEYNIWEYGSLIISNQKDTIGKFFTIRKIVYIDTPMMLNEYSYNSLFLDCFWKDTYNVIEWGDDDYDYDSKLNTIISNEIIKGETSYDISRYYTEQDEFTYKRDDGSEFNLLDSATGIKSFAMLQLMLKNGFLGKHTLLIIDEPESHLHPQWVVEYARLIVLLNKRIGVNFFIACHNPDMISAIKYISEKEEVDSDLNFYFAERNNPEYTYSYKHLGTDIEPIFESFNISLDRISQYGTKE